MELEKDEIKGILTELITVIFYIALAFAVAVIIMR